MKDIKGRILLKLNNTLTNNAVETSVNRFRSQNNWYNLTYRRFIERFNETRGETHIGVWVERVALVYSWLPKIPLSSFNRSTNDLEKIISCLNELELIFFDANLSSIGNTAYHGPKYHGEKIFASYKGYYDVAIREFLSPAGYLLHNKPSLDTQLSSTTKLLHFMCPSLFPIFDSKVCNQLYGTTNQTYKKYHAYVFAVQEFLNISEVSPYIFNIAQKMDLSPLYIIDQVLFNIEKED